MRLITALPLALLVAGCTAASDAADEIARDQAKSVVNGVVEQRFPGVNVAPVTDCIIDQASAREILSLAGASVTGVTDQTISTVIEIAERPEASKCILRNGLAILQI